MATKVLVMLPARYRAVGRSGAADGEVVCAGGIAASGEVGVLDPNDDAGDPRRHDVVQCSVEFVAVIHARSWFWGSARRRPR